MRQALLYIGLGLVGCSQTSVSGRGGPGSARETPRAAAAQVNLPGNAGGLAGSGPGGAASSQAPNGTVAGPGGPPPTRPGNQPRPSSPAHSGVALQPGLSHMPGYQASLVAVDSVQNGSESLARGYQLYQNNCSMCHGSDLKGPESNTGMPTRDLTQFSQYKYGSSDQALYRTLVYGIPRTAMGNFQSAFKPEQIWDMVHFLKSKRQD